MAARRLIIAGIAAVVGAVLLLILMLALARDPDVKTNLGEKVFTVGDADSLAEEVDTRGPLLFQDLLGGDRDILVDHVRDEEWLAYTTALRGDCRLELVRATGDVRNTCDDTVVDLRSVADVKRAGAMAFSTDINENGELVVDLRRALP